MEKNKAKITSKVEELETRLELGGWMGGNEDKQECGCCGAAGDDGITIDTQDNGDGKGEG